MDKYYVYILKCSDSSFYTGIAKDLNKRLQSHLAGKASKYTRCRLPVEIVYYEMQNNRSDATKRELEIKSFTREEKLKLINKTSEAVDI